MIKRTKPILQISGPMILANLSVPLLGLVDTAILGHLESASILAAAALGAHILSLFFWSFGFLRMSTTGLTSRRFGASDFGEVKAALIRSLFIASFIALAILSIGHLLLNLIAQFLSNNASVADLSSQYLQIRIWSAPATLATYCFVGWLIGIGRSKGALSILLATNIANGFLDYLLIIVLEWGIQGAAFASLIAEYIGLVTAIGICVYYFNAKRFKGVKLPNLLDPSKIADLLQANLDLFIRTLSLLTVFLIVASTGVGISPEVAAANAILLNMLAFSAYAMDGFAYAAESLCGRAWGKKNFREFWLIAKESTLYALLVGIAFVIIFLLLQEPILNLYTDLPKVIFSANAVYFWMALLPLIAIWCYQLDGIFIGIGHTAAMRNAMLFSFFLVFLPVFVATQKFGATGIWVALWAFHLARIVGLGIPLRRIVWAQKRRPKPPLNARN